MKRIFAALLMSAFLTGTGWAQEAGVWVQVEAQPTLGQAQTRVRDYASRLDDVSGYFLGSGWYGIALGPYTADDAANVLRRLREQGAIPGDSFIADGSAFEQQFWPIGVGAQTEIQSAPDAIAPGQTETEETVVAPEVEIPVVEPPPPEVPDETEREARASEELLSRPEKELLQTALAWAGFYDAEIDGAFGRGTRNAMGLWQEANGYEPTGILTTRQRAVLLGDYNAVLEGLDLQLVRDDATGIEMQIPTGAVEFAAYEPPFALFDAKNASGAQVLLISQAGDENRLFGLYEILQTLEIVPTNGPRERSESSFTIEGIGPKVHSFTEVTLADGQIKGFTLVWPAGDEERRTRLLSIMRASFVRLPGVLDPALARPGEDQAVDLISGLEVRQPQMSRSGFFIDDQGTVLTTSEVVDQCEYLTLDSVHLATVIHRDDRLGLAVLRPDDALAPMGVAAFQAGVPRLQAEIAVSGYPYGGVLSRPALTFGRLADIRGLNGEEEVKRLSLVAQEGDAGGPVFDNGGAVLGLLLPKAEMNGQVLPPEVSFSVDADAIIASLQGAGIAVTTTDTLSFMPPETLTRKAAEVTVLVSCW
jgi:S1-C subfamily serine protease